MAKKKKEEVKLIEDAVFDSVEKAQKEVKFAKFNMIRTLIGAAFAVLSTVYCSLRFSEKIQTTICMPYCLQYLPT